MVVPSCCMDSGYLSKMAGALPQINARTPHCFITIDPYVDLVEHHTRDQLPGTSSGNTRGCGKCRSETIMPPKCPPNENLVLPDLTFPDDLPT